MKLSCISFGEECNWALKNDRNQYIQQTSTVLKKSKLTPRNLAKIEPYTQKILKWKYTKFCIVRNLGFLYSAHKKKLTAVNLLSV